MKKIIIIFVILLIPIISMAKGFEALNFSAVDTNGNKVELSKYKGKVVILDFWATWCPPCVREIPNLKKIYKEFGKKDFEIISIALERKPDEFAKNYVIEHEMNWTHIISRAKGRELAGMYKIRYIPTMFILNKEGKIVANGLRGEKLKEKIAELLK